MNSKDNSQKNAKKKAKRRWRPGEFLLYDFVKITGALPMLLFMRPRYLRAGKEKKPKGAYLVFANHSSPFDPIAMLMAEPARRPCVLATTDIFRTSFTRWFFTRMHCVEVDKKNFSINSLHQVLAYLREGRVVGIFPEGYIHKGDDRVSAFKSGMILMAFTAGVPVVPLYLAPPRTRFGRWTFIHGDPIDVRALCGPRPTSATLEEASRYVYEKELALKAYYEEKCGKNKHQHTAPAEQPSEPVKEEVNQ